MTTSVAPGLLANRGHLLENIIFVHLRHSTEEIYYYRTKKGHEVDFIWLDNKGKRNLVQVCLSLKDPLTKKREISSLMEAMSELGFRKSTLITLEEENIMKEGNKIIEVVPVWKYIL
jgi:predicted AAA+ superfamily ATPase